MKQKDYKAIADILASFNFDQFGKRKALICKELADYFEKECKEIRNTIQGKKIRDVFNRSEFLKDCGVEK